MIIFNPRSVLVPNNYDEILEEYTRQGFRVIALAHRTVEIRSIHKLQKVQREELEHELTFLGILKNVFLNLESLYFIILSLLSKVWLFWRID